ncbi:thiol reductant ABC exporter subunit CydC [Acrocarpospora catenulata]|uniref:thiol reductant ABC exporter subunit CydC n=1 Tax=Acrocarpospora catenulata TaxID=2836182 RepID=UPI002023B742|nr:thiol reductant ABC exporter subunit CydC [Acrocarpospora catenulata]
MTWMTWIKGMAGRLTVAALAGAAADLFGIGLIASAAWLITRAAEQPPLAVLSVAIVGVRAFATGRGVLRYAERLAGHDVALRAQARTREELYTSLIPAGPLTHRGADLLSRMVDDTDAVQDLLVRCLLPAIAALATGVVAVVIGVFLLPTAAVALLVGLVMAGVLLPLATATASRRWSARLAPARAELASRVADLVHGAADLAAYGAEGRALEAGMAADDRLAALERRQARTGATAMMAGVLAQGLTVVAVVWICTSAAAGTITTTVLALVSLVAFEPVLPLAAAGERLTGVLAALRRLREIKATPPAVHEPSTPVSMPSGPLTIEIQDLAVHHSGRPALDGVSLTLTPGRRVAVVGPSGAGKSTLLSALMRTVDYVSGKILINGIDVRDIASDDVRGVVSGLTQDPYVFQASIKANLRLAGPDASDGRLEQVVQAAHLETWVARTGWDTELGEDGRTLSGGQLQRLALARALLYDPRVLLLDEPAEALDEATADDLMTDLLDATHGRTTLLVTHRLRGLEAVDEIIVLENGKVIQQGTHAQLLKASGYYRALWQAEAMLTS